MVALALAALVGACAPPWHEPVLKLCRSILPALHDVRGRIDVLDEWARASVDGPMATITFTDAGKRRSVTCVFRAEGDVYPRLTLVGLATEAGPLGEVRLRLLNRGWIEGGHATVSDPAPVRTLAYAVEVSPAVARAAQIVIGALPGTAIYALLAAAYALIYGLIGRINLAFGELAMLAGYGGFLGYALSGASVPTVLAASLGALVAIYTAASHGFVLARSVFGRLIGRPGQHTLIATVGMAMVWSEAVRLFQGHGDRWIPPFASRPLGLMTAETMIVTMTAAGLMTVVAAAVVLAATLAGLSRSAFGRTWRAVADDPLAAELVGVDPRRVLTLTMALAAVLASVAGLLTTLVYGGVGTGGGLVLGLKALIAAVVGGIGSVGGAVAGAILIGLAEALWSSAFSIEFREAALFCGLAILLVVKPEGLFARRVSRAASEM